MNKIYLYAAGAAVIWSGVVVSLLSHAVSIGDLQTHRVALAQARTFFQQVVEVRSWNASHGGVYVEVTDEVLPNPYLDVPERDIETTTGRKLTLVNPAYMTRQIAERGLEKHGVTIHITSLKPIRPENAPTDWETEALRSFEDGAREYASFVVEPGRPVFRYMAPLAVEENCLGCHAKQGYRLGDVRGGISVTIPDETLVSAGATRLRQNLASALIIWLTGLGAIGATAVLFGQKQDMVQKLQDLSLEDPLTGLRNRRGFLTLCAKELEIARRWRKNALLLFIDVDYLKEINDTYGHAEGDAALRAVGRVIASSFREADVAARIGGDEFGVFCIETSPDAAGKIITHFRGNLAEENAAAARDYRISVSLGAARYDPPSDESLDRLMARADAEMYAEKSRRRRSAVS